MADDLEHLVVEARRKLLARELRTLPGKLYEDAMESAATNR